MFDKYFIKTPPQSKNSNLLTTAIVKNVKLRHIGLLLCFTNTTAKGIFVSI